MTPELRTPSPNFHTTPINFLPIPVWGHNGHSFHPYNVRGASFSKEDKASLKPGWALRRSRSNGGPPRHFGVRA
ncbi:hypothetical protein TNCV_5108241 [Trichonephila clavipes]|nr:hypothetical protein TNCV_5108241 [Trichonephila clavipes]